MSTFEEIKLSKKMFTVLQNDINKGLLGVKSIYNLSIDDQYFLTIKDIIIKEIKDMSNKFILKISGNYLEEEGNFNTIKREIDLYFIQQKVLAREIVTIYKTHKNNPIKLYNTLLSVKELPEEAKKILKKKIDEFRAFEASVKESFDKEVEKLRQKNIENINVKSERQTLEQIVEKANNLAGIIEYMDKQFYEENISKLLQRLNSISLVQEAEIILEEIKLQYLKVKKEKIESEIYREEIIKMTHLADEELKQILGKVAQKRVVTKEDFNRCLNLYTQSLHSKQHVESETLLEAFKSAGYKSIIQDSHGIFYFDTPAGEEYKVRIKFDGDRINIQFVRLIEDSEEKLSEYEKEVDLRKAKEFCQNLDSIFEILKNKYGIMIDITKRVKPEERMFYIRWQDIPELNGYKKKYKEEKYKRHSL